MRRSIAPETTSRESECGAADYLRAPWSRASVSPRTRLGRSGLPAGALEPPNRACRGRWYKQAARTAADDARSASRFSDRSPRASSRSTASGRASQSAARATTNTARTSSTAQSSVSRSIVSGGAKPHDGAVRILRQDAAREQPVDDIARGDAVAIDLDADEESLAAHLADQRALDRGKTREQMRALLRGACDQSFFEQHVERRSPTRTRADCRRTCCRDRPARTPASGPRCRRAPRRQQTAAQRLAEDDAVGRTFSCSHARNFPVRPMPSGSRRRSGARCSRGRCARIARDSRGEER